MEASKTAAGWSQLTDPERAVAMEVLVHGPLARADLARRLRLSPGSLSRITAPLVAGGLLREGVEPLQTTTGRQGRGLEVVSGGLRFVGVRLTADDVTAVLTDLHADVHTSQVAPLEGRDPDAVVRAVCSAVAAVAGEADVCAVGVGVGGRVSADGDVMSAVYLDWRDVALGARLHERTGLPIHVENDVIALTTAEHWFGAGRGTRDLAVLTIGAGVGSALVAHDEVHSTVDAGVGLLGHLPLGMPGPRCLEGHLGCATAVLSDGSLAAQAAVALGRPVTREQLLDLASAGDTPAVRRICADLAVGLGRLVAIVANVTQLARVVVVGEGVPLASLVLDQVTAEVSAYRHPLAAPVDLTLHEIGTEEWARGAAAVAIQRFVSGASLDTPAHSPVVSTIERTSS